MIASADPVMGCGSTTLTAPASLAILIAMRRASSRVSRLAANTADGPMLNRENHPGVVTSACVPNCSHVLFLYP